MSFTSVSADHFETYIRRMAGGVADKLFFADRMQADVYVDFGCADGMLLRHLKALQPDAEMIGYDLSELATARAAKTVDGTFFSDWPRLEAYLHQFQGKSIALIASSVIHEVYAYGGKTAGETFWRNLNQGPFTHFILRDMSISSDDVQKTDPDLAARVRAQADQALLQTFEEHWGSIENRRNLVHFLLKYRYGDNWDRELAENYLPITREEILDKISGYFRIDMHSHEILPFLANRLAEDFGIAFPCTTHFKLILERL